MRERLEKLIVRLLAALPTPVARLLAGRPIRIDGQTLHPEVQLALRLDRLTGAWEPLPPPQARERTRRDARTFAGKRIEVGEVSELAFPGPAGELRARLYSPRGQVAPGPLVVYYHGGGHVIGDLDTHDQPCRFLASQTPAHVLSVDYRLGPEHRFPAAVEDALAAFRWAHENAAELGADPDRIAVAGDSAGGNLAAVVSQLAGEDGGPKPAFQALIYPVTDYSAKRRSYELFREGFFLTADEMDWFRDHYFARASERTDPRASPLLAEDVSGLPPTFVLTCGFDPLRDEGEAYAERLREAGVACELRREPDLVHAVINTVGLGGRSREVGERVAAALRGGLAVRGEQPARR